MNLPGVGKIFTVAENEDVNQGVAGQTQPGGKTN
jgi:hypothetical protein